MYSGILASRHPAATEYKEIGGSRLPRTFGDYAAEYRAIRDSAALFDHTALGLTKLTGDRHDLLQRVLARDLDYLEPERAMTSLVLDAAGTPIDLVTVYSFDDCTLLESSWGCAEALREQLRAHVSAGSGDSVTIESLDGEWGVIGIEGPYAWGTIGRVVDPSLGTLPYETVIETEWRGFPLVFTRCGLTGEYGYKLIGQAATLAELWTELAVDATPAGQQALETAMTEVRQPVLYQEAADGRSVVTCGAQWLADLSKTGFIGREALVAMLPDGPRTIGLAWTGDEAPAGSEVSAGGSAIGSIHVCLFSPGLDQWLALATVAAGFAAAGLPLTVRAISGQVAATTLAPPYVHPTSWVTPIL